MAVATPSQPVLVAIDWGTTSFRAALLAADGRVLDSRAAEAGIMQVADRGFAAVAERQIGAWRRAHPAIPTYASGMIGSRNGWVEVPYLACPAGRDELAASVVRHREGDLAVHIVPGLIAAVDGVPEVMRGEEVQIIGAEGDGLVVLPGTHSKWAVVRNGRIERFATFMTGDLYAVLRQHTILGRLMAGEEHDAAAFLDGVRRGHGSPHALPHLLFGVRTLPLVGRLPETGVAAYLSGLLIGVELAAGQRLMGGQPDRCRVIGSARLTQLYIDAGHGLGLTMESGPDDAAWRGCLMLARCRGDVAS